MYMQDLRRLANWCMAPLRLAILSPLRNLFFHRHSRCGHVFLSSLCIVCSCGLCGVETKIGFLFFAFVLCVLIFFCRYIIFK